MLQTRGDLSRYLFLDELGIEPRTFRIQWYAKRTLYQLSHTPEEFVVVDGGGGSGVVEWWCRPGAEP
jgi:hypothetical protein